MALSKSDLMTIYQWFNYIRSANPAHLEEIDMKVAKAIRRELANN